MSAGEWACRPGGPAGERGGVGGRVRSVNVGALVDNPAKGNFTAIGKRPVGGAVWVSSPRVLRGESGLDGDAIGDSRHHGGTDQAVYALAREELDYWETELGRELPDGSFGENLTLSGADPDGALLGERWRIGAELVLAVTGPRIPCATFTRTMGTAGWAKRFNERGRPGAYLRVVAPGHVGAGDQVELVYRPSHRVSISMALHAFTIEPRLLPLLLEAGDDMSELMRREVENRLKHKKGVE
jgi:MOSC domain-containing protein YiiM